MFNTSGQDYRALGLADKLPAMTEAEALALLAGNGRLVKRPFVLGDAFGLVGFNQAEWTGAFREHPTSNIEYSTSNSGRRMAK